MSVKNNFVDINGNDIEDKLCAEVDSHGLMCPEDKVKLLGIEEGATKTIVDSKLDVDSENPVMNKVITDYFTRVDTAMDDLLNLRPYNTIPAGADLNSYTEPGSYNCPYTTDASAISNLPSDYFECNSGFTLYVLNNTTDTSLYDEQYVKVQILIYGDGTINTRYYYPEDLDPYGWSAWSKLGQNNSNDSINLNDKWAIQLNSNGNLNDVWIG